MIPKIIHHVWLGGGEKPELLQRCRQSWARHLPGYEIIEWSENNFDLAGHPWLKKAYADKAYAFAADLIRLSVLREYGGIYLDADVEVKKDFSPLLNCKMFLGFELPCALGTAVIGAIPRHPVLAELSKFYDTTEERTVNNTVLTRFFLANFPDFRLNNRNQVLPGEIYLYHTGYFTVPAFGKNLSYARHFAVGSWDKREPPPSVWKRTVRKLLGESLYLHLAQQKRLRKNEFYPVYRRHVKAAGQPT